ncbi:hypothetical protein FS749_015613 [Ceratobasidium sp. UAMH 11750]|nr:hypothetical protein FS749_015613 [Ceratobasidium sp. UAMH 11750]
MPTEPKLTKKQKKGLAFRERRGKTKTAPEEPADIPEPEVQDEQERPSDGLASARNVLLDAPVSVCKPGSRKRKRADAEGRDGAPDETASDSIQAPSAKKSKKKRTENSVEPGNAEGPGVGAKKFILFVGNLPYTISKEQILEHFQECKPPPSIRLLTSKPRSGKAQTAVQAAKSKGCAFLEFSSHGAMQLAIRKHHTELVGRRINVELTAGGGGNSDQRKEKLRLRNRTLDEQRKKGADRLAAKGSSLGTSLPPRSDTPTRHSTTSGAVDQLRHPKTWSIPSDKDEINSKKTRKIGKGLRVPKRASWTPSGANAISVG